MYEPNPFFSIVIANFNYGKTLSIALDSIFTQDCEDYEVIVVDGGSSDNSVDIIKRYQQKLGWWVSEPDNGQSNAFNKGFSHAMGKYFTWLNADDILLPGTLSAVKKKLLEYPNVAYGTGNFVRFSDCLGTITEAKWGPHILPDWLQGQKRVSVVFGPSTFWKKEVYDKLGPIDENLFYNMDNEYWERMIMAGYKQVRINHYCWAFRMHSLSKTAEEMTPEQKNRLHSEQEYLRQKNGHYYTRFWRIVGLIFRVIDGSYMKSIYNQLFTVGKDLRQYFKIDYPVK